MKCPLCRYPMIEKISKSRFYTNGERKIYYECIKCNCKLDTNENKKPILKYSTYRTIQYRKKAHVAFDEIWKSGIMNKKEAYEWLSKIFRYKSGIHISNLNTNQCKEVIKICKIELSKTKDLVMIEYFDIESFKKVLPDGSYMIPEPYLGEYIFMVPVNSYCKIQIRSSIRQDGCSAFTGKDSIRLSVIGEKNEYLGKIDHYVTRQPGWEKRLDKKIKFIKYLVEQAGVCQIHNKQRLIGKVKKNGPNHGRYFATCHECSKDFKWLDYLKYE